MKKIVIPVLIVIIALTGCGLSGVQLTDEMVENYIAAMREMRGMGMDMDVDNDEFEAVVQDHGFEGMVEFMKVTMTIGAGMSLMMADGYNEGMSTLWDENNSAYADILNNPDVPEEEKQKTREMLAQAEAEYKKNQQYAQPILDLTSKVIDEQSLEVMKKYKNELIEVMAWADQSGVDIGHYNYDAMMNPQNNQ